MDMRSLVAAIQNTPGCAVRPPAGLPKVADGHVLPDDLREFYTLCGGATLFSSALYDFTIVPPDRVVPANPVILVGATEEQLAATKDDISWSWYIIGESDSGQYISIDLNPERLGRCYDSFWEVHPGNSPTIARSFTDLLVRLLADGGQSLYWTTPDFDPAQQPKITATDG